MKEYLKINKKVYENLAPEYDKRWRVYLEHEKAVLKPLESRLKKEFDIPISVLDVGCGVGLDSYILSKNGFVVIGIDFSPKMLSFAERNVPSVKFVDIDFLEDDFEGNFQGIILNAFIQLFPKRDVSIILEKVKSLLVKDGYCLISITKDEESKEGYMEKIDYPGNLKRFRKFWTKKEIIEILEQGGFKIVEYYEDYEKNFKKNWMNIIFQKN